MADEHNFNERSYQDEVLAKLQKMGYKYLTCYGLTKKGDHSENDVFLTPVLNKQIKKLNPGFTDQDVEHVIKQLKNLTSTQLGRAKTMTLAEANQEMIKWLQGKNTIKININSPDTNNPIQQEDNSTQYDISTKENIRLSKPKNQSPNLRPKPVRSNYKHVQLIDFKNIKNNSFIVSDEVVHLEKEKSRFDIIIYVNGIPLVFCELKSPYGTDFHKGRHDMEGYIRNNPSYFVPNIFSFVMDRDSTKDGEELNELIDKFVDDNSLAGMSEKKIAELKEKKKDDNKSIGFQLLMGSATAEDDVSHWKRWGYTDEHNFLNKPGYARTGARRSLDDMERLCDKENILNLVQNFCLFKRDNNGVLFKLLPRYHQVEAVDAAVARVYDKEEKQGLINHYQGSGKTMEMIYTANRLYRENKVKTIILVFDDLNLLNQATKELKEVIGTEVNIKKTEGGKDLKEYLARDEHGIITTMVHRFNNIEEDISTRSDIAMIVDEAHRTQEKSLGNKMRKALPNATFIGFTGTPLSRQSTNDRDTYLNFGSDKDDGRLLSYYPSEMAQLDKITVPILIESRRSDLQLDEDELNKGIAILEKEDGITDEQKDKLIMNKIKNGMLGSSPRIDDISRDALKYWREKCKDKGMGMMIVCGDREMCISYSDHVKKYLKDDEESQVVMSVSESAKNDMQNFRKYKLSSDEEEKIKKRFKDKNDPLKILIVTSKLLTGFDAPNLGILCLDKIIKQHTLLQTIARVNRSWNEDKKYGIVIDYLGISHLLDDALFTSGQKENFVENMDIRIDDFNKNMNKAQNYVAKALGVVNKRKNKEPDGKIDDSEYMEIMLNNINKKRELVKIIEENDRLYNTLGKDKRINITQKDYQELLLIARLIKNNIALSAGGSYVSSQRELMLSNKSKELLNRSVTSLGIRVIYQPIQLDPVLIREIKRLQEAVDQDLPDLIKAANMKTKKDQEEFIDGLEVLIGDYAGGASQDVKAKLKRMLDEMRKLIEKSELDSQEFVKKISKIIKTIPSNNELKLIRIYEESLGESIPLKERKELSKKVVENLLASDDIPIDNWYAKDIRKSVRSEIAKIVIPGFKKIGADIPREEINYIIDKMVSLAEENTSSILLINGKGRQKQKQ